MTDTKAHDAQFAADVPALSVNEKDALGEIGNICMGTAATTLSTLLGKKVSITTPVVNVRRLGKNMAGFEQPYISVEVSYIKGIQGYNLLLLKQEDVAIITAILMGEAHNPDMPIELDELHFSAISEVMNQMVGSSATALSSIIMDEVNISPPVVHAFTLDDEQTQWLRQEDAAIIISFALNIENVLSSEIMQILPYAFGKKLVGRLLHDITEPGEEPPHHTPKPKAAGAGNGAPPKAAPPAGALAQAEEGNRIGVRAVQYKSFDEQDAKSPNDAKENIDFIMDVPLQVTVELGKCKKTIKEILSLNTGSIIVLDKHAGEMVDIFVNGKLFAVGEVVVIDDNYGVRVTDIVGEPRL